MIIGLTAIVTEGLARQGWAPQWLCRKVLHVVAVGSCALAAAKVQQWWILILLVAGVWPLLFYLVYTGKLFRADNGTRSWGIVWFPLAYLLLLLFFPQQKNTVALAMAILALSDAAAAIVGKIVAWGPYNLTGDPKTLAGSSAFVVVTAWLLWPLAQQIPAVAALPSWLLLAIFLAALEALGSHGTDNLLVPLGAGVLLSRWEQPQPELILVVVALATVGFAVVTLRRQSLNRGGAVSAALLGWWVTYLAGPWWLLPLGVFFFTSVAWGKLNRETTPAADAKQGKARDHWQVWCNGGIYAFLLVWGIPRAEPTIGWLLLATMAISTADTWASEWGQYLRGTTFDLVRWTKVPVGLSGGVSVGGTLAGLVGAALIGSLGFGLMPATPDRLKQVVGVTLVGFLGMLVDSLLGSVAQARYLGPNGQLSDTPLANGALASGWSWLTNDGVNLLSNAFVVLSFWLWLAFFGVLS